jgi:hypothetical protein
MRNSDPNHPKIQHTVPQFILKNFSAGKKRQIYVFDKRQETAFRTNIKNAACEQHFYDLDIQSQIYTFEPSLAAVEAEASHILQTVVTANSLSQLSTKQRRLLSKFVAVQFARVNRIRQGIGQMNMSIEEKLGQLGANPADVKGFKHLSEEEIKETSLSILAGCHDYARHIFDKTWILFQTSDSNPFYISDNPVTLQNMYDFRPRGNLGLAVKGIEIYFPVSKLLTLGMICPSYLASFQAIRRTNDVLRNCGIPQITPTERSRAQVEELINGLEAGTPISIVKENVINLNSLQVAFSTRFIYSCIDDFALVRDMLAADSRLKEGRCFEVN